MVEVETWFQEEGRVAACRNWLFRDASSGRQLGRATRHGARTPRSQRRAWSVQGAFGAAVTQAAAAALRA